MVFVYKRKERENLRLLLSQEELLFQIIGILLPAYPAKPNKAKRLKKDPTVGLKKRIDVDDHVKIIGL